MTKQEIKDNAPCGATHIDRLGCYFMKTDDSYFVFSKLGNGWSLQPYNFTNSELDLYGINPL